MECAVIARRVP